MCKGVVFEGIILWMRPANEKRRYIVTPSLISWTYSLKRSLAVHIVVVVRQSDEKCSTLCIRSMLRLESPIAWVHYRINVTWFVKGVIKNKLSQHKYFYTFYTW